jgi:molecular chaperone HtpG
LRFVRGVVDSEDMPLNISREMLQNNPLVEQIRKALTGRVIAELQNLAAKETNKDANKEADVFAKVWEAFGRVLKEGIYEDHERRDALLALARFETTKGGEPRTLKQYVADLRPNQTEIYYLVGESAEQLRSNPKLEAVRARGIEVLLLTDPVDALWTSMPQDFEGKPLKSLSQSGSGPRSSRKPASRTKVRRPRRGCGDRRGEGRSRRACIGRTGLTASDRQSRLSCSGRWIRS